MKSVLARGGEAPQVVNSARPEHQKERYPLMTVLEYGEQDKDIAILIHSGGLHWWNYRDAAECSEATHNVFKEGTQRNSFNISNDAPLLEFASFNINIFDEGKFLLPVFTMGLLVEKLQGDVDAFQGVPFGTLRNNP